MQISEKVHTLITDKLGIPSGDIQPGKSFIKDYGVDSLDLFEFMIEIEKAFDITIPDEQAEKITTVGQLVEYVSAQQVAYSLTVQQ